MLIDLFIVPDIVATPHIFDTFEKTLLSDPLLVCLDDVNKNIGKFSLVLLIFTIIFFEFQTPKKIHYEV